jgi:DNA topoisomerase-1
MIIKLSRSGKFYSCARFPDCTGALTMEGKRLEGPKEIGENCPECSEGKLVEREGRFGTFISCSRYPKCKFIKKDPKAEAAGDTGVECPLCKKGTMREKRGRFGVFYGCSNYPDCKNIIKTKPTGNICPMCSALMMEGTKTIPERCSNKACPNHNPHKIETRPA